MPNLVRLSSEDPGNRTSTVDLDSLPPPDYSREVYPSLYNGGKLRLFSIDESRDCPMDCSFCINGKKDNLRFRKKSAVRVTDEIRSLRDQWRSKAFRFAGNYTPIRLLRTVCQKIIEEKLHVEFGLFLHGREGDDDLFRLLRAAGCYGIFFGVESGSDVILEKAMNKKVTAERLREVLRCSLDAGLFTGASFIFPSPFETTESEKETRGFIEDVFRSRANCSVVLMFPGLLPESHWWRERDRFGFHLGVDEESYHRILLKYKIRHIIPPSLWEPLPYRLGDLSQVELARRNNLLQLWVEGLGIPVNLPDHDAQVGAALNEMPFAFKDKLRYIFFTGNSGDLQDIVNRTNEAFSV